MKYQLNFKILVIFFLMLATTFLAACGNSDDGDSGGGTGSDIIFLDSTTEDGVTDSFLARILVNTPSLNDAGIILIHGRGGHPDKAVVRQLRHDLFGRGYTTISIQAPVPAGFEEGGTVPDFPEYENDVNGENYVFPETYARVRTAVAHLNSLGANNIFIIGFSMGSRMGAAYVARGESIEKNAQAIGFVGIGMIANSIDPLNHSSTLDEINVPVLDLYGDGDISSANTAPHRILSYSGVSYTQVELDCAAELTEQECHKLDGLKGSNTAELETVVSSWIAGLLAAM